MQTRVGKFQCKFNSEQRQVSEVVVKSGDWLKSHRLDMRVIGNFEIVLSEALNNIIEHAYKYRTEGAIDLTIRLMEQFLEVDLCDSGCRLTKLPEKKQVNVDGISLEDLPEGGFGWFLIYSLTEELSHNYRDGQNVLWFKVATEIAQ